jgi:membrane-associated protease RseP (regulator of RpoE activity)
MDRVYPPFQPLDLGRFVAGEISVTPGRTVRMHVTRETRYGDRYKLFSMKTADTGDAGRQGEATYGATLEREPDGRYYVANLAFKGLAEKAGLDFGDYITEVDVEQLDQPAKEWIWPFALLLLGLVLIRQWVRWRRLVTAETVIPKRAEY